MLELIQARIEAVPPPVGGRRVVGLAGAVAAGKTTLAHQLADRLGDTAIVSTDVFLLSNAVLDDRGIAMRKGFPESYDWARLASTVEALHRGDRSVRIPSYSHVLYDIEPGVGHEVPAASNVIIEGINCLQVPPGATRRLPFDLAIYLETAEVDQRRWHADRLIDHMRAAADQPESFYHPMAGWSDDRIREFSRQVFDAINAPNGSDHIRPSRAQADLVVSKDGDHRITAVT